MQNVYEDWETRHRLCEENDLKTPWLLQRIAIPLLDPSFSDHANTLSKAVKLDYMGKAEFEFGAMPASLRSLAARSDADVSILVPAELPLVRDREKRPLLVVGMWPAAADAYQQLIAPVVDGRTRVCSGTGFEHVVQEEMSWMHPMMREPPVGHRRSKALREAWAQSMGEKMTRAWWDLNNGVFLSFEPAFMERLGHHLVSSWESMDPVPAHPTREAFQQAMDQARNETEMGVTHDAMMAPR